MFSGDDRGVPGRGEAAEREDGARVRGVRGSARAALHRRMGQHHRLHAARRGTWFNNFYDMNKMDYVKLQSNLHHSKYRIHALTTYQGQGGFSTSVPKFAQISD